MTECRELTGVPGEKEPKTAVPGGNESKAPVPGKNESETAVPGEKTPQVAIILVNYGGYADTKECVDSILKCTYSARKILIVENGSADAERMKTDADLNAKAQLLYSGENLGFSGGCNLGIRKALEENADYCLLLNNDTTVDPEFLAELVHCAKETHAAVVTGDIFFFSHPDKLWYSCGIYERDTGITRMCGKPERQGQPQPVSFASGCLMLIRSDFLRKHGGLSEEFFLYSEDTEFSLRAAEAGEKVFWTPKAKIFHKVSASIGENSAFQQYYLIRNNLYLTKEYGTAKPKAYLIRLLLCFRYILGGHYQLTPLLDAVRDFRKGITGRSGKY